MTVGDVSDDDTPPPASTGRSTAIFALWTAVSRLAGLAREIIVAHMFGVKGAINAFVIAFNIPNLLRSLVADAALSARATSDAGTRRVNGSSRRDDQAATGASARGAASKSR